MQPVVTTPTPARTKTVLVQCTYTIAVEVPADWDEHTVRFNIEENSCPGTGLVGAALDAHMDKHEAQSTCWACALGGKNVIKEGVCDSL